MTKLIGLLLKLGFAHPMKRPSTLLHAVYTQWDHLNHFIKYHPPSILATERKLTLTIPLKLTQIDVK